SSGCWGIDRRDRGTHSCHHRAGAKRRDPVISIRDARCPPHQDRRVKPGDDRGDCRDGSAYIRIYSGALVTAPVLSTYHRSFAIGTPAKRCAIQSATIVGGYGPRLTDGQAPMAWRAS